MKCFVKYSDGYNLMQEMFLWALVREMVSFPREQLVGNPASSNHCSLWHFTSSLHNIYQIIKLWNDISHTSWAIMKAETSRRPGRSRNDQLRERVTNIKAWLMVLTWRYTADANCSLSGLAIFSSVMLKWCWLKSLTLKCSCQEIKKNQEIKRSRGWTGKIIHSFLTK